MIETRNITNRASSDWMKEISFPLYQRHPLLGTFAKVPGWCVMFGYFAIIALASWWQWPWLPQWLRLWMPIVDILREFLPVFDKIERSFAEAGFGHRVAVVHHLFMAGWLFTAAWLLIWTAAVFSMSWRQWISWASKIPFRQRLLYLFGFLPAAGATLYWIIFGFAIPTEYPLYAFHRYDLPLFMISTGFLCATLFTLGAQVFSIALLIELWRETV